MPGWIASLPCVLALVQAVSSISRRTVRRLSSWERISLRRTGALRRKRNAVFLFVAFVTSRWLIESLIAVTFLAVDLRVRIIEDLPRDTMIK